MYIVAPSYDIQDFLSAVNFITPPGTTMDYFIVTDTADFFLPQEAPFTKYEDIPEDQSVVYQRTDPILKQDFAEAPVDYSYWDPQPMGRKQPIYRGLPNETPVGEMGSPFVKVMNESSFIESIILEKKWGIFPENTIFHFRSNHVRGV